jgi:hypothetical protein
MILIPSSGTPAANLRKLTLFFRDLTQGLIRAADKFLGLCP